MDAEVLRQKQIEIDSRVLAHAQSLGLTNDGLLPVYDGVADERGYLSSSLKVVWVLKEPWDDLLDGRPSGGGWSIVKHCFREDDGNWNKDGRWKNRTWQSVAYVMHGLRTSRLRCDMSMVRDDHSILNELKTVGWVNASKMPNYRQSSDCEIVRRGALWREIVVEQMMALRPDVIIFGRTFSVYSSVWKDRLVDIPQIPASKHLRSVKKMKTDEGRLVYLFNAMHPGRKGPAYCDALIEALLQCQKLNARN